jgi:hypothetical protein
MTEVTQRPPRTLFVNKRVVQEVVRAQNEAIGFEPDPTATGETAQQLMLAHGIRPEDNLFSRGIIAARDEE